MMYSPSFLMLLLLSILSSCVNQTPAPIEYGSEIHNPAAASKSISHYDNNSSDEIVTKSHEDKSEKESWTRSEDEPKEEEKEQEPVIAIRTTVITHEVIEGETLDSIAKQYGITKEEIIAKNNLKPPYELEELQILLIPPQETRVGDIVKPSSQEILDEVAVDNKLPTLPVQGEIIAKFGENYMGSPNQGINIFSPLGTNIDAVIAGTVVHSAYDSKFGNLVIIKSSNSDIFTAYAHMNDLIVKKGAKVNMGDVIGHVGQSGNVTKPQLHFAVRSGRDPIDPIAYLKQK